jgi:hypothetical protein
VLADFPRRRRSRGGPVEVPLPDDSPVAREWAIVCVDERYTACMAGWEQPREDGRRRFETVWTTDPDAATTALQTALGLAGGDVADRGNEALERLRAIDAGDVPATLSLANRIVAYLAADHG